MAQSTEYPDLLWMPPKSWTNANRSSVQLIVIHTTEGSAHGQSAEDGAAYDQKRTDGTSTHYFHDNNSTVQCVYTADQAHTARTQGNKRGIQHELCTRSGSANWSDSYHQAMLRNAARQAARDAEKWGIPVKKLSATQVAEGVKGFCGHVDITNAFPQDNGTHTDPGSNFPWSAFLDMVQEEMGMALSDEDKKWISTEIAKQVKAGIDAACKLVAFDDEEGGSGSQIGQAVLNSGYPKTSGAKRSAFWANQRDQQNDLNEVLSRLPELPAN